MQVATARMQVITGAKVYDQWLNSNMDKKTKINIKLYAKPGISPKIKQEGLTLTSI